MARKKKRELPEDRFVTVGTRLWHRLQPLLRIALFVGIAALLVGVVVAVLTEHSSKQQEKLWAEYSRAVGPESESLFGASTRSVDTEALERLLPSSEGTSLEPVILLELFRSYLQSGKAAEALKLIEASTERLQTHPLADILTFTLAKCYMEVGEFAHAHSLFERIAQEKTFLSVEAWWYAGYCAEKTGQLQRARSCYERANISTKSPFWAEMAKYRLSKLDLHQKKGELDG